METYWGGSLRVLARPVRCRRTRHKIIENWLHIWGDMVELIVVVVILWYETTVEGVIFDIWWERTEQAHSWTKGDGNHQADRPSSKTSFPRYPSLAVSFSFKYIFSLLDSLLSRTHNVQVKNKCCVNCTDYTTQDFQPRNLGFVSRL